MSESKLTEGEWFVHTMDPTVIILPDGGFDIVGLPNAKANAHLIASAPDMYQMIESLTSELNAAIDEVNTMRDIHHTDNMTPADHWDKESLHDAQVLLAKARGEL